MLTHEVVSGVPIDGVYSQTFISGEFYIVLSLSGEMVNLELGHNVMAKLEEIITQSPDIMPAELVDMQPQGNILVAKIIQQKLYVAGRGEVFAKLTRADKLINLFTGSAVSGMLLHNDSVHLTTVETESLEDSKLAAITIKLQLQPETVVPKHFSSFSPRDTYLRYRPNLNVINSIPRRVLFLSLISLITLICLVVFQLRSRVLEKRVQMAQEISQSAEEGLASSQKLVGINDVLAKNVLVATKTDFTAKSNQNFGSDWPQNLKDLQTKLDKQIELVSHVYPVPTMNVFYDFSLLKSGAKTTAVSAHGDQALVLDQGNGAIYSLNLKTKNAAIVSGKPGFKTGQYTDFSGTDNFVWSPEGILFKDSIKPSEKWGKIVSLRLFAGNIYLLDSQNNQIWKYQGTELGFADVAPYLKAGSVDFSNAKTMDIDGSIYVLTTTGNLAKFTQGMPENFTITGVEPALSSPIDLFATDDTQNIYILESNLPADATHQALQAGRVVILDKKGNYLSQYTLPDKYDFLAVSESTKKLFLFQGAKVYSFDLK